MTKSSLPTYQINQIAPTCIHVNRIDPQGLKMHVRTFGNVVDAARFTEAQETGQLNPKPN